jgi:PAS domain S-box-containing protein
MDPDSQAEAAVQVYKTFINSDSAKGIGQQERTKSTAALYDSMSMMSVTVDPQMAMVKLKEESERTLNLMAFDAFPRFVKSKQGEVVMKVISGQGNNEAASLMANTGNNAPKDADDWLNMFVATAESFPACIVISDMTIPGAPMVFVNKEFCNTTGYDREEAVGRNCRFLQGPDTEPEAIQVIRNTLCKGQDCHVKLTNYRKNGEKFQNLLSMRPVFDADGIYRFVIGVQFEIKEDSNLKQRLVQLDKLLKLLPTKLNLRSKASSRAKGALAVKVSGEANTMINNKEAVLAQTKMLEQQEEMMNANRPKQAVAVSSYDARSLNYDKTIAAFTKIMWLQNPVEALRLLLFDNMAREYLMKFSEDCCGEVVKWNLKFLDAIMQVNYFSMV